MEIWFWLSKLVRCDCEDNPLAQQCKEPMTDITFNCTKGDGKQRFSRQVAVCH